MASIQESEVKKSVQSTVKAPERFSLITFNVWNTEYLAIRQASLTGFLNTFQADVFCLQECCSEVLDIFDKTLITHDRIRDTFAGWTVEGNMYWNKSVFSYVSHGTVDIGLIETNRRLFWVKLKSIATGFVLVVGNCHYTWEGAQAEEDTGFSKRVDYSNKTAEWLKKFESDAGVDAVTFAGDLNDRYHPRRILRDKAGYVDSMGQLRLPMQTTWPTPSFRFEETEYGGCDFSCDWIFSHPSQLPVIGSQVLYYAKQSIYPSDHFPVLAFFQTPTSKAKSISTSDSNSINNK